jgi:cytochrome c553
MRKICPATLLLLLASGACTGKYIRPTTNEVVQATPERLTRGSYLVNQAMGCGTCHTTKVGGTFLGGERTDRFLAGNDVEMPSYGFKFWIPNITPDKETGIGAWTDDQIMRAIRDGIGRDEHLLFPMMPFNSYQHVSDEDLRAIVAFLRSVPPVKAERKIKENEFGFLAEFFINRGIAHHLPAKSVAPPDKSNQVKYGEYVMRLGHCWECHSHSGMGATDVGEKGFLSGSEDADELPGVGKVYMRNLTPDPETGLGKYSADQIKQAIRTGHRLDGKPMAPPMSMFIPHFSGIADEDLDALVAFIKSIPPVKKKIPDRKLDPAFEKTLATQ